MSFLTETQLRGLSQDYRLKTFDRNLRSTRSTAEVSIFLSHSHKDRELALGLQRLLTSRGLILYLDWQDTDMPARPNRETADRIKARIGSSNYFLLLATANAMTSRWVPWEVGIADSRETSAHIIIVPVIDAHGTHGNEYLDLYRSLEIADSGAPAVFEPNQTRGRLVERVLR